MSFAISDIKHLMPSTILLCSLYLSEYNALTGLNCIIHSETGLKDEIGLKDETRNMRGFGMRLVIWLSQVGWQISWLNLSELSGGWINHRLAIES